MDKRNTKVQYLETIYEKLTRLGTNAEESTWLVKDTRTDRLVVWKEVRLELLPVYEKLRAMEHGGFARVYGLYDIGDRGIVIEEYVSGCTLEDFIERKKTLSKDEVDNYMGQLLHVVEQIHRKGIIHRDINPNNILLSTDGVLKLIDFGIARQEKVNQTRDTTILGTVGYASPEQFGFRQTDERTDIYALGVVLNVMLTGKMPAEQIFTGEPYCEIIRKCIQMEPDMRYQNVGELASVLLNGKVPMLSIVPGFRTGKNWKKVMATIGYAVLGLFTVGYPFTNTKNIPVALLNVLAILLYAWMPLLLLTDFGYPDKKIAQLKKLGKPVCITLRIILALFIFYWGIVIENYLRENYWIVS